MKRWHIVLFFACASLSAQAAEQERPNILFAFADDWGRHAGTYGTDWIKTPTFDRIAKQGILFDQAYTATAKCAPSRASVLTGRYPWQNEQVGNHLAYWPKDKFQTYMETLTRRGYYTARVGKGGRQASFRKAVSYAGRFTLDNLVNTLMPSKHFWMMYQKANRSISGFAPVIRIEAIKKQKHTPERLAQIDLPSYWEDTPELRQDVADYAFEVERFDSDTGKMIELLEERGLLENTLIIMSSDHGMPFPRAKGDTYMAGSHVPLSVMWKGHLKQPGRTCTAYVNFVDIAPTILELAGINPGTTKMEPIQGRSWTEIFRGEDIREPIPERAFAIYGRERYDVDIRPDNKGYPSRAIRKGKFLYINNLAPGLPPTALKESGGIAQFRKLDKASRDWKLLYGVRPADELYNVEDDPECVNNLAGNPEYAKQMNALRSMLLKNLREQKDPRVMGGEVLFDTYPATTPWLPIHKARVNWEKENAKNNE